MRIRIEGVRSHAERRAGALLRADALLRIVA
jgi:hypothetical protein